MSFCHLRIFRDIVYKINFYFGGCMKRFLIATMVLTLSWASMGSEVNLMKNAHLTKGNCSDISGGKYIVRNAFIAIDSLYLTKEMCSVIGKLKLDLKTVSFDLDYVSHNISSQITNFRINLGKDTFLVISNDGKFLTPQEIYQIDLLE
jgi:hypothetical protein